MAELAPMDRRTFVKRLGGGIVVFVVGGPGMLVPDVCAQETRGDGYPEDVNAYLRIAPDGTVTFFSGKVEMGQGIETSLAQMLAEELRVGLDAIRVVMGDTDLCPYDRGTWGSLSTRFFGPAVRAAGARARAALVELAARKLGVAPDGLVAEAGVVRVAADPERSLAYGALAAGEPIAHTVDGEAILRSVKEFTVMGRSPRRLDGPAKVTGTALYAADHTLPGMLHARILRPPSHGAKLGRVDTAAASKRPGVRVVREDDFVAVLHADPEQAERALAAVEATWEEPAPATDTESIFEHLLRAGGEAQEVDRRGDLAAGRARATRTFEATYKNGYVAHAPIEPHAALAVVEDGRLTVWSSTQAPFSQRTTIARHVGFPPEKVRVITPYVGGGFGGKAPGQQANEAALLAKLTGKPVQVAWTRAEEFFYDTFRPAAVVRVASGLDGEGRVSFWDYEVHHAGSRGAELLYDLPHARVRARGEWWGEGVHPFAVGAWRAPGANTNVFAAEGQMDRMAAAAGVDALEFRLAHASDPRLLRVLRTAAERYGWKPRPAPAGEGRGRGIACGTDVGTFVVAIADVAVDRASGRVRVERVVCVQDMGIVVNPEGARMQIEGCVTMGLGYALAEELRFEGGRILDTNFDTYELPRFSWLPEIETVLVPNDELSPQGGGEPAIVVMGAVIANAVFDATGIRHDRLPITPARVRAARPA